MDSPKTYFALYIGSAKTPAAWFAKEHEAQMWADIYYDQAASIDIRPYEVSWPPGHTDERLRPNVFLAAEELTGPH